ncbi:MAG TPA: extracellular solute-binding protein [Desulfitobacteriaceae bacterium]|nr:extracellular solute-binding protein [Desulfitobacteriaceae bacterium]
MKAYSGCSCPKSISKLLPLLILLALVLGGCQNIVAQNDNKDKAPAVITIWHTLNGAEAEILEGQLQNFSKTNPAILVKMVYVPEENFVKRAFQAEAGGEGPEIFLAPKAVLLQLYAQGTLAPAANLTADAFPAALAQFRFNSQLYAQPWLTDVPLFFFNKDKAPIPTDLASLSAGQGQLVLPGLDISLLSTWWNGQGGQLLTNGKPALDQAVNLAFLEQLLRWRSARVLELNPKAWEQFASGQVGYTIAWASQAQALTGSNIPWDSLPLSALLGGEGQALCGPTLGVANSAVKTIEPLNSAIQTVEQALLDPQLEGAVAQAGNRFPANSLYYSSGDNKRAIEAQVKLVLTQAWVLEGSALEQKLFPLQEAAWQDAFAGMSAQEALARAQNEALQALAAL